MTPSRTRSDWPFFVGLGLLSSLYLGLIVAMLVADLFYTTPAHIITALNTPEIRYAIRLSLLSSSITTLLALWVAVPLGYLLSRVPFPGKWVIELLVDVPVVLPPLVVGLSLLILFQTAPGRLLGDRIPITYEIPAVILAQFAVSTAFAVRTMRVTFDQLSPRTEQVALTLGCSRSQAFWLVTFPEARRGLIAAATLAWARSLGEFGPVLIFAGTTRMKTEVLPTTVFLELSVGNLEAALAVSLLMIGIALVVLLLLRLVGLRSAEVV